MLYENYQKKIQKIATVLSKVVKHLAIIIAVVSAILVISVTLLATKGLTGAVKCESTVVYGEDIVCKASSFLSGVRYQYAPTSSEEWSDEKPIMPGTYKVRGVGVSSFGNDRYGKPTVFTILPLSVKVWTEDESIVFGDMPSIKTDPLVYGDKVAEYDVKYGNLGAETTAVLPDVSAIVITDKAGNDVTAAYTLESVTSNMTFTKRPIKVITQSSDKVYDGKPFTFDQYELGNGSTLGRNDYIIATFSSITNVGTLENTPTLVIYHEENGVTLDVTHQYDISTVAGQISVTKRPIVITTGSLTAIYTGKNIECLDYTVDPDGLVEGHRLDVSNGGDKINRGVYENVLKFSISDEYGNGVNDNYSFLIELGKVEILPADVTVITEGMTLVYDGQEHTCEKYSVTGLLSGHKASIGNFVSVKNVSKVENKLKIEVYASVGGEQIAVTDNYNITYQYGFIEITPRKLEIITASANFLYGAITAPARYYSFEAKGLVEEHNALIYDGSSSDGSYLSVGSYKNEFSVKVQDQNGREVTSNYEISYQYGTLNVEKRLMTVKTGDYFAVYDGRAHSCNQYSVTPEGALIPEHYISVADSTVLTDAGKQQNKFYDFKIVDTRFNDERQDVTDNYSIKWEYGYIEILKRPISVIPEYAEKIYDGTALYGGSIMLHPESPFDLVAGHRLDATTVGNRTDAGESIASLSNIKVYAENVEVTKNYDITAYEERIVVLPRPILIETAGAEKVYDGKPLTNRNYYISEESPYGLVDGQTLSVTTRGTQTDIGESENYCLAEETRIRAGSKDVTANYEISYTFGLLVVKPYATIAVISGSAMKYYDGKPLTNPEYEVRVIEGELAASHNLKVNVYGSITNVGSIENDLTVRVVDSVGRDVSAYYVLQPVPGTLVVKDKDEEFIFGKIKTDRDGYIYLKERSYGDFNGQIWNPGVPYSKTLSNGLSYSYLTSYALRNANGNINFAEFKDLVLPMLPYYMGFDGDYVRADNDVKNVSQYGNFSMSYYSIPNNSNGFDYLAGNLGEYTRYEEEYRKFVYQQYLTIDGETLAYMKNIIKEQSFSLSDPNVILKIARYIQNAAKYSLEYDPFLDYEENVAIAFLETYKEGKCTHYATAATLLYRALGIPARYVEGFMIETKKDTFVDIKNPGHAWVEVYIDGVGWIYVEVTGSDDGGKPLIEIKPSYTYKNYDGTYLYPQQKVDADIALSELLSLGYSYKAVISGSQLEVGSSASIIESFTIYDPSGQDVTDQFNIKTEEGTLEVFPQGNDIIKIYLYQLQKYYDGTPLRYESDDYEIISMPDDLSLKISFNIEITDVGVITLADINENIEKLITYRVYKGREDVTKYYTLICDVFENTSDNYVPLRVDPRFIEITSASETRVDNGKPLENGSVSVTQGSLIGGHTLSAKVMGYLDMVGSVENYIDGFSIVITDINGNDVSENYYVMIVNGTLTLTDPKED